MLRRTLDGALGRGIITTTRRSAVTRGFFTDRKRPSLTSHDATSSTPSAWIPEDNVSDTIKTTPGPSPLPTKNGRKGLIRRPAFLLTLALFGALGFWGSARYPRVNDMLRGVLGKYGPFGKGAVVYLEESESHKRGPESAPLEVDGPGRLSSGQLEAKNKEEARTGGHKARPGQIADGKATSEGGDALLTRPLKVETKESVAVLSQVGDGEARPQGVKSPIASPREVEEGTEALAKGIPPRLYSAKPAEPDHRSSLGSDRVPEYTASDDKDSSR